MQKNGLRTYRELILLTGLALLLAGCAFQLNPYSLDSTSVNLPFAASDGSIQEVSFDPRLERVIVPGGKAGGLALIDPNTRQARAITGFEGGITPHLTSAAVARGFIYALDPTAEKVYIIDPDAGRQVGSFAVEHPSDIIRFVPTNNELWVTQPEANQIEVFTITDGTPPTIEHSGAFPVPGGPKGLIIDRSNGVAYTNQPDQGTTAEIQIFTRSVLNSWANGCTQGRDLAIDEERRYLFVACNEGKLVVIDLNEKGVQLGSINYGGDLNGLAYNSTLRHLYLPSGASGIVGVFAVQPASQTTGTTPAETPTPLDPDVAAATATALAGIKVPVGSRIELVRIGTADTALEADCITVDSSSNLWVCDPKGGRLFLIEDTFPAD